MKIIDFADLFNRDEVLDWGRAIGYVQRLGKIHPFDLLYVWTFGLLSTPNPSLDTQASKLPQDVKRQAVDQRFTPQAVAFVNHCLATAIGRVAQHCSGKLDVTALEPFSAVKIIDSTSWDLPAALKDVFAGCGGSASEANCRQQVVYELKTGALLPLDLLPGNVPDQSYAPCFAELVGTGELGLGDLGYFSCEAFWTIDDRGGYFASRMNTQAGIWIEPGISEATDRAAGKGAKSKTKPDRVMVRLGDCEVELQRVNLVTLLRNTKEDAMEFDAVIGVNQKLPLRTRIVCFRAPAEVANRRRQKLREKAKKKGRTPTAESLELCGWTIFITNAPADMLPGEMIRTIYRARWAIELVFKQLKSTLRINQVRSTNHCRVLCETRGRLIAAVITHGMQARAMITLWTHSRKEISFEKVWKRVQENAGELCEAFQRGPRAARRALRELTEMIFSHCIKEHQPSRLTTLERLEQMVGDRVPKRLPPRAIQRRIASRDA